MTMTPMAVMHVMRMVMNEHDAALSLGRHCMNGRRGGCTNREGYGCNGSGNGTPDNHQFPPIFLIRGITAS